MPVNVQAVEQAMDEATKASRSCEDLVDDYYAILRKIDEVSAQIERKTKALKERQGELFGVLGEIEDEIRGRAEPALKPEQQAEIVGKTASCTIGKAKKSRKVVDKSRLFEILGENAVKVATVALSKIDDYLTPEERAEVLEVNHDGPRRFKVEPLA